MKHQKCSICNNIYKNDGKNTSCVIYKKEKYFFAEYLSKYDQDKFYIISDDKKLNEIKINECICDNCVVNFVKDNRLYHITQYGFPSNILYPDIDYVESGECSICNTTLSKYRGNIFPSVKINNNIADFKMYKFKTNLVGFICINCVHEKTIQ